MSTFAPETFDEAKKVYKPMRRSRMATALPPAGKTRPASGKPPKRGSSAVPYATNSLKARKKGKRKKLTDGKLKKLVWAEFSKFIRTRGADSEGMNDCYTCDVRKHWKQLEAGHLVPGRTNAVLFNELSVRPQCRRCNGHFRGNTIVYYPKLVGMIGQEAVDQIVAQRDVTHKWEPGELAGLLEKYKTLNASNPLVKEQR